MKPLPPLPLCCVLGLVAGAVVLIRKDWHREAPLPEPALQHSIAAKSVRDRMFIAATDTDRGRRSARFATVFQQLTPQSATELASELWEREKSSPFQNDWYDFLRRWAELDPKAALAFAQTNAGPRLEDWLIVILPAWGRTDREAARGWWPIFIEESGKVSAALIGIWGDLDWQAAVKWAELNCQESNAVGIASALATSGIPNHASEVQARIDSRLHSGEPPTAIEAAFFDRLVAEKLNREKTDALSWLGKARSTFPCPSSVAGECERLLVANATSLLSTSEEWGAWVGWLNGTAPDTLSGARKELGIIPDERPDSGVQLFSAWLTADSEAASQWLNHREPGPCYDALAFALAQSIAADAPESAIAWAITICSPFFRATLYNEWQRMGLAITPEITAALTRPEDISAPSERGSIQAR